MMLKYILSILTLWGILCLSCCNHVEHNGSKPLAAKLSKDTQQDILYHDELVDKVTPLLFIERVERKVISFKEDTFINNGEFTKNGSQGFSLNINNGKELKFNDIKNPNDETENISYEYKGINANAGLHWIKKRDYECEYDYLVKGQNGFVVEVWNQPMINFTGKFVFSTQNVCADVFDDFQHGFQIWKNEKDKLHLYCQVQLNSISILEGHWISDKEIFLTAKLIEDTSVQNLRYYVARVLK